MKRVAALAVLLLALAGCGETTVSDVPWDEYAPQVHDEAMNATGDCAAIADLTARMLDGDDAHRARYGHGNSTIVAFLDGEYEKAGCSRG